MVVIQVESFNFWFPIVRCISVFFCILKWEFNNGHLAVGNKSHARWIPRKKYHLHEGSTVHINMFKWVKHIKHRFLCFMYIQLVPEKGTCWKILCDYHYRINITLWQWWWYEQMWGKNIYVCIYKKILLLCFDLDDDESGFFAFYKQWFNDKSKRVHQGNHSMSSTVQIQS